MINVIFNLNIVGGIQSGSTRYVGHLWPIVPAPDDCKDGEFGGMKIGRGNQSTRRKTAPAPLCPPQIPRDQIRARNDKCEWPFESRCPQVYFSATFPQSHATSPSTPSLLNLNALTIYILCTHCGRQLRERIHKARSHQSCQTALHLFLTEHWEVKRVDHEAGHSCPFICTTKVKDV
jgi:hypothetical protein